MVKQSWIRNLPNLLFSSGYAILVNLKFRRIFMPQLKAGRQQGISLIDTIIRAIESKNKLEFTYNDETGSRAVYPHAMYKNSQDHLILDAYQVSGFTTSDGKLPQWKMFNVVSIAKLTVLDETFIKIVSFNPASDRYKKAMAVIK
jgi:hypothetical protein